MSIDTLQAALSEQAERLQWIGRNWTDWHTPPRLALALASEVGELCHLYRFNDTPDPDDVASEVADVFIFLLRFATVTGIDLTEEVNRKMGRNFARFTEME